MSTRTSKIKAILYGQLIAFVLAGVNASSYAIMERYKVNSQLFQLFCVYSILSLHIFFRKKPTDRSYSFGMNGAPWWIYLLIALLDVLPNFMTLLSYQYTSLMSTTLLGSLTAPSTMLCSFCILQRLFRLHHFGGVLLCVTGGTLTLWLDARSTDRPDSYIGDSLAILSALIYGLGDTLAEYFVKYNDRMEYMGMLGIYGMLFTGVTFPFREWDTLVRIWETPELYPVLGLIPLYVSLVVMYYMTELSFLVSSDATLLNISMQSSNIWAIFFSAFTFGEMASALFFVAFALVLCGVVLYELAGDMDSFSRTNSNEADELIEQKTKSTQGIDYGSIQV